MATTEQFENMTIVRRRNPMGKKLCNGYCGSWRHFHDFGIRYRTPGGIPATLTSYCKMCSTLREREKRAAKGIKPRHVWMKTEGREILRKGQEKRWDSHIEQGLDPTKKCPGCTKVLSGEFFGVQKRKRSNGEKYEAYRTYCRKCERSQKKITRQKMIDRMTPEELSQYKAKRRIEKNRSKNKLKKVPQKQFRPDYFSNNRNKEMVSSLPFRYWHAEKVKEVAENQNSHLYGYVVEDMTLSQFNNFVEISKKRPTVSREVAELILTRVDGPNKFFELYPEGQELLAA